MYLGYYLFASGISDYLKISSIFSPFLKKKTYAVGLGIIKCMLLVMEFLDLMTSLF